MGRYVHAGTQTLRRQVDSKLGPAGAPLSVSSQTTVLCQLELVIGQAVRDALAAAALGPARSLDKLHRLYQERLAQGLPAPSKRRDTLARWSKHYGWVARARELDAEAQARQLQAYTSAGERTVEQASGQLVQCYQERLQALEETRANCPLVLTGAQQYMAVARLHNETAKLLLGLLGLAPGEPAEGPDDEDDDALVFRGSAEEMVKALQALERRERMGDGFVPPPPDRDLGEGQGRGRGRARGCRPARPAPSGPIPAAPTPTPTL